MHSTDLFGVESEHLIFCFALNIALTRQYFLPRRLLIHIRATTNQELVVAILILINVFLLLFRWIHRKELNWLIIANVKHKKLVHVTCVLLLVDKWEEVYLGFVVLLELAKG